MTISDYNADATSGTLIHKATTQYVHMTANDNTQASTYDHDERTSSIRETVYVAYRTTHSALYTLYLEYILLSFILAPLCCCKPTSITFKGAIITTYIL